MYVNDIPLRINSLSETILFADDTSVIKFKAEILKIFVQCAIEFSFM